jgi:hypothetical protein
MAKKQTKKATKKVAKKAAPKKGVSMRKLRAKLEADIAAKVIPTDPIPGPGEILIRNGNDNEPKKAIAAERLADYFAIHPTPGTKNRWSVTHVPTGCRCGGPYRNRTLARFVATELRALGGDELWQFTKPEKMPKTDARPKILELSNAQSAEALMQDKARQPVAPAADPAPKPAIDQSWRSKIDWVAAGKKAYESRMANLAKAQQAAQAPPPAPAPAPKGKARR